MSLILSLFSLFLFLPLSLPCEIKSFPYWDCLDDNNCGNFRSCRKTGTYPDFLCLCVDVRCDTFNLTTGACLLCKGGHSLTASGMFCPVTIPDCQIYRDDSGDGFCQQCLPGYTITIQGRCSLNITNCTSYASEGVCEICTNGYIPYNNSAICVPVIPNCLEYNVSDSRVCRTCLSGFERTETAIRCAAKIEHCLGYFDISGTCKQCDQNFSLSKTGINCVSSILNCLSYDDATGCCLNCSGNLVLTKNAFHCVQRLPNCLLYDDISGNCTKCEASYVLIQDLNICVNNISSCLEYDNSNGSCKTCYPGFTRSESGWNCYAPKANCVLMADFTGECEQCVSPYVPTRNGAKCVNSIESCQFYDDITGMCSSCLNGLMTSAGGQKCCSQIDQCLNYSDNSCGCTGCSSGFLNVQPGVKCIPSITSCSLYNYTCVIPSNKQTQGFICLSTLKDCQVFGDILGNCQVCCTNCSTASQSNSMTCVGDLQICEHYNDQALCSQCEKGFERTLTGVKCVIPINECLIYDDITGFCSECTKNHVTNPERTLCLNNTSSVKEDSNINMILAIVLPTAGTIFFVAGLFSYYYFKKKKSKWPSKLQFHQDKKLGEGLLVKEQTLNPNLERSNLVFVTQSFGHHETKTISLGCALLKIGEFIEREKTLHEIFVFEILGSSDPFSGPLQIKTTDHIGKGGYGTVFKAVDYLETTYALKIFIDKGENDQIDEQDLIRFKEMIKEKMNLRALNDENIILIKGIAYSFGSANNRLQLGIVEPLMDQDLKGFLELYQQNLTISRRIEIALKICVGLNYMHYRKYIHNDIKPQNILLNWEHEHSKIDVKLSDFGTMQKEHDTIKQVGITLEYASPERILQSLMDVPLTRDRLLMSDIWSLGCVIYKIFSLNPKRKIVFLWSSLLKSEKIKDMKVRVAIKQIIEEEEAKDNSFVQDKGIPDDIKKLINNCLQVKPEKRPYVEGVIEKLKVFQADLKN